MKVKTNNSEKLLNGLCIYTPGGAAREYAAVGCNFYRGCPYQCQYCYNRKGITAKVMGVDHAVLQDKFTKIKRRPKKYRMLSGEEYAYMVFRREADRHLEYLKDTGIFFSFSTDPMCKDTIGLTMSAMLYATGKGIPVKILTKNADFTSIDRTVFKELPEEQRRLIAIGYTLTGRDDWEPHASSNEDRIRMMAQFHDWGYKTFASIEPIVDFDSSFHMIEETVGFCDQYLIGLMSSRNANGLEPYDPDRLRGFIANVEILLWMQRKLVFEKSESFVYWKESIRHFFDDEKWVNRFNDAPYSVSRDWSLFKEK